MNETRKAGESVVVAPSSRLLVEALLGPTQTLLLSLFSPKLGVDTESDWNSIPLPQHLSNWQAIKNHSFPLGDIPPNIADQETFQDGNPSKHRQLEGSHCR